MGPHVGTHHMTGREKPTVKGFMSKGMKRSIFAFKAVSEQGPEWPQHTVGAWEIPVDLTERAGQAGGSGNLLSGRVRVRQEGGYPQALSHWPLP